MKSNLFIENLNAASLNCINNGDIGIPKFVRYITTVNRSEDFEKYAKLIENFSRSSFSKKEIQNVNISDDSTYITKLLKWNTGEAALLTVSIDKINLNKIIDLLIIGSKGSIYHST